MFKNDALAFFGSATKLAQAAGVSLPAVSRWGNVIPERRAARLDRVTDGALKYDPEFYLEPNNTTAA
ncbi:MULTISPECIES: Cro/CI family transcriptional regulator [Citrobacter]|uniref:Cro/CI family transcriptional regulator n=1 Tax=Citrobacter TaxID=544 RepID=UPI001A228678|nr:MULTISPECIES: Cro/CI family transcriptional regulator [Citrobacter freundii complex]EHM6109635.1 hypothetical protein [Salmonella enterica]EIZ4350357.1 hypothetical protein [Salmonella bongori serovar 48:z81:-]EJX9718662.1 hypothetical protein [Salmonella bongori]EIF5923877.1 hypothetical protein [Salmonella enterica]EIF8212141.1 hypothetical protein [Salmonella enterica]